MAPNMSDEKTSDTDASQAETGRSTAGRRFLWFAVLWLGGVACVLTVSWLLRLLMSLG